jgi:hypothetical protein
LRNGLGVIQQIAELIERGRLARDSSAPMPPRTDEMASTGQSETICVEFYANKIVDGKRQKVVARGGRARADERGVDRRSLHQSLPHSHRTKRRLPPIPHLIKIAQTRLGSRCKHVMPDATAIPVRGRFSEGIDAG